MIMIMIIYFWAKSNNKTCGQFECGVTWFSFSFDFVCSHARCGFVLKCVEESGGEGRLGLGHLHMSQMKTILRIADNILLERWAKKFWILILTRHMIISSKQKTHINHGKQYKFY